MYKIEEIVKDPIKLSVWLCSKNQGLSPIYKCLLDNPKYKLSPDQLPRDTKIKGRVVPELKFPEWSYEEEPSLTSHAIPRGIHGAWIWPNVVRDIEKLNPGVKLSMADAKATLKASGWTIDKIKGYAPKAKHERFTKDPSKIIDSEVPLETILEFLFGNKDVTWATAIQCISKLDASNPPTEPHMPLQVPASQPAKLVVPPISRERHVLEDGKHWNKFTLARDYTLFNNQFIPNPRPPVTIDNIKDTYTLSQEPHVYLQAINDSEMGKYIQSQANSAPFPYDEVDEKTRVSIENFITSHLSARHFVNNEPSAILAGLQVKKNFNVFFNVRQFLELAKE